MEQYKSRIFRGAKSQRFCAFFIYMGIDLSDIFVIAGLLLMAAGLYFVYAPLALIIPGVILLVIGFYSAIKKARD